MPLLAAGELKSDVESGMLFQRKTMPFDDISGIRFGRLIAKERVGKKWLFACDCGGEKLIHAPNVRRGLTKSCGCYNREVTAARNSIVVSTHRMTHTPEYKVWQGMRQRCENENDKSFKNYGGRGIAVCPRWQSFANFFADMGERPSDSHSLDRIDVNGDYEAGNCRWATMAQQARNKRTNLVVRVGGASVCLADAIPQGAHSAEYQRARKLIKCEARVQCR